MRRRARRKPYRRLNAEVKKILAQPETRQRLLSWFESAGGSPVALAAFEKQERASGSAHPG